MLDHLQENRDYYTRRVEIGDEEGIAPPPNDPKYAPDPLLGGGYRGDGRSQAGNMIALVVAGVGALLVGRALGRGKGATRRWTAGSA